VIPSNRSNTPCPARGVFTKSCSSFNALTVVTSSPLRANLASVFAKRRAAETVIRPIPLEAIRRQKLEDAAGTYAILHQARRLTPDDAGPVVELFTGQKAFEKATRAAKRVKHSRVVKLRGNRQFRRGDHINQRCEIEHENHRF
jgi:hypothetical protein